MQNKYTDKLKKLLLEIFSGEKVKIILFGSRARNTAGVHSDVDLGFLPFGKLDAKKMQIFRDKLEDLNIPYKVDVVDLSKTSEDFRKEAMKGAVLWKEWN